MSLPTDFYARSNYIMRAPTSRLYALLETQLDQDQENEIQEELDRREYDLADPSSGLGVDPS